MSEDKAQTAGKFTALSRGWSEREYRDPSGFMRRRAAMVREWGATLHPGDRVLELGCGDGALSCMLAAEGFDVTGVDISRGMIDEAKRRAERESAPARFEVADSDGLFEIANGDHFKTGEPFDAVVSFMSAFFTYTENPANFIARVAPLVRKKVILDWNFRSPCTFVEAARALEHAGLQRVEWRPWLVPHTAREAVRPGLRGRVEGHPNLSLLLLILKRWHYTIHLKGEKAGGASNDNDNDNGGSEGREKFGGHALPGGLLQRTLIRLGQTIR
jgi:SAM-dependent methyltransferase